MLASRLSEVLRGAPVPDSGVAEQRTEALARAALERLGSPAQASAPNRARPRLGRAALAAACALALAAFLVAPPGRSAAAWLGELVGIGDGESPVPQPVIVKSGPMVILGTGEAPSGTAYKVTAGIAKTGGAGQLCVDVFWVERELSMTDCGYPPSPDSAYFGTAIPADQTALNPPFLYAARDVGLARWLGADAAVAQGIASAEVGEVQVTYRDKDGFLISTPARLYSLEGDLQARTGAAKALKAYVAFPPAEGLNSIRVTAYDQEGEVLGAFEGGDRLRPPPPGRIDGSVGEKGKAKDVPTPSIERQGSG